MTDLSVAAGYDPTIQNSPDPFAPKAPGRAVGGFAGTSGAYGRTGVQQIDSWLDGWHEQNIGRQLEPENRQLIDTISTVFSGRKLFDQNRLPTADRFQPWQHVDTENTAEQRIPVSPLLAAKRGFDASTIGALRKWAAIDGPLNMASDPNFDVFNSPALKASPFKDQVHLFMGAHSEQEVQWRILQMQERERESRILNRMGGGGIFEFAGGMLGDPLNLLPATLGFKGVQLAARTKMLHAPETVLLGFKPVIWGGIGDGLRAGAAQAAIALVDAGLHSALDPSHTNGSIGDIVTLPGAIAASLGALVGAAGRYQLGMEALSRKVGNHDFLAATRPVARTREGGREGPMAPGVLTEGQRSYWDRHVKENEVGRVHVDGRVQTVIGDDVYFRTAEGVDVVIPLRDVDIASTTGARGIAISSRLLTGNDALMGSAMRLDGPFVGGGRPKLYEAGADVTAPGTLHTDYDGIRAAEMAHSDTGKALGTTWTAKVYPGEDPRGEWALETTDGVRISAKSLPVGTRVPAEDGGEFIVVAAKGAGEEPSFRRTAYGEQPEAIGTKVWQQDFKPGELEEADEIDDLPGVGEAGKRQVTARGLKPGEPAALSPDGLRYGGEGLNESSTFTRFMTGNLFRGPDGQPVRVFHGTHVFFDRHATENLGTATSAPSARLAHFFSASPETASGYAGYKYGFEEGRSPQVRPSYLRMTNPMIVDDVAVGHTLGTDDYGAAIGKAKAEGYDGVIFRHPLDSSFKGDVYAVFDPEAQILGMDQRYTAAKSTTGRINLGGVAEATADVDIAKGSLSAANIPGAGSGTRRTQLEMNRLVSTGLGIEKLPFDIYARAAMLPYTTWQTTIGDMVSPGSRLLMKNTGAFGYRASALSAETLFQTEWKKPMTDTLRAFNDEWRMYREGAGPTDPSDSGRKFYELTRTTKDLFSRGPERLSFAKFLDRVGDAQINNDIDFITDEATPYVNNAAAAARKLYKRTGREGAEVGLYQEAHEAQIAKLEGKIADLKKNNAPLKAIETAETQLSHVQGMLTDILTKGAPQTYTALSHRPRVWLKDVLRERALDFKQIADDWLRTTKNGRSLSPAERAQAVDEIHETLLRDRPIVTKAEVDTLFNDLADPASAKARTFQIPDVLVKDFLESNAEVLLRNHVRHMGMSIEMHRKFGSTGMEEQIGELAKERDLLVAAAPTNEMKKELIKKHDLALKDLEATRDRLYGVYGAPDDPHRWQSRTVRMAKQFTNITVLGMSGVTALGDLIRPLMTEGLQSVYEYGFKSLASDVRGVIFKMNRGQLERSGAGGELINNTRALAFADAGDMGNSRSRFERNMAQANSWSFVFNGLNHITQVAREWTGVIVQGNMNAYLMALERGERITPKLQARLANSGVEVDMAKRMGAELRMGNNDFDKLTLADTDAWTDRLAAQHYDAMLNQLIHRIVPTPGIADTPNWMSTEAGSLIGMYKGFMFGAMNRTMISGLQEEGQMFWFKAASAVGFAIILNEIRSRLFYERSTMDKPMTAIIMDGIDRSAILGYFSDANKAIEVLTSHRTGLRPLLNAERVRQESPSRVLGTVGGPAVGQAVNALSVFGDIVSMHPTARTMADARRLLPLNNVPYLDPIYDRLVSDGNPYPQRTPKRKPGELSASEKRRQGAAQ